MTTKQYVCTRHILPSSYKQELTAIAWQPPQAGKTLPIMTEWNFLSLTIQTKKHLFPAAVCGMSETYNKHLLRPVRATRAHIRAAGALIVVRDRQVMWCDSGGSYQTASGDSA